MAKYYIFTGEKRLETIISAGDIVGGFLGGVRKLLQKYPPCELGMLVGLSERGFDWDLNHLDTCFCKASEILDNICE